MSAHWITREYDDKRGLSIVAPRDDAPDETVPFNDADVICTNVDTDKHAALIAAAPDLLTALRALVAAIERDDDEGLAGHAPDMERAYAAISKAEAA